MSIRNRTPSGRVTIHDVACKLDLSISTVSSALNGTGKLKQSTRERVQRAAAELGYTSSRTALALRLGRTGTIALALPSADNGAVPMLDLEFYMSFARAAATVAFEAGYALTFIPPTVKDESDWHKLDADGVVLCDPVRRDERLAALERIGAKVVTVECDPARPDWRAAVMSDNEANLRALLEHLYEQGARRIALIGADTSWSWAEEGVAAYSAWVAERGLAELVRLVPLDHTLNEPYHAAMALLRGDDRPDAIIAMAEQYREGVLRACRDTGMRVPDDMLVALGIDSSAAERNDPALTAIDLQPGLQAKIAVSMLLGLVEGRPVDGPVLSEAFLRVRASTLRKRAGAKPPRDGAIVKPGGR